MAVEEASHDGPDHGVDEDQADEGDGRGDPDPGTNRWLAPFRKPADQDVEAHDVGHQDERHTDDHEQQRWQVDRQQRFPVNLKQRQPGCQQGHPVHVVASLSAFSDHGDA